MVKVTHHHFTVYKVHSLYLSTYSEHDVSKNLAFNILFRIPKGTDRCQFVIVTHFINADQFDAGFNKHKRNGKLQ